MIRQLCACLLLLAPWPVTAEPADLPASAQMKVEGKLHGVIQDRLPVTVRIEYHTGKRKGSGQKRPDLVAALQGEGFTLLAQFDAIPILHAIISTRSALTRVLMHPDVIAVSGMDEYRIELEQAVPLSGASTSSGYLNTTVGQGLAIAVLDTGYTGVANTTVTYLNFSASSGPYDVSGHGTTVAWAAHYMAPKARIISMKVCDDRDATKGCAKGQLDGGAVDRAIEWVYANAESHQIKALNISLSSGAIYAGTCSTTFTRLLSDMAPYFGVVPVVATGNQGSKSGIADPACGADILSVGATYDANVGGFTASGICTDSTTAAKKVACFANSGSALNVFAAGCRVNAMTTYGASVLCGTSLAAPVVAGGVVAMAHAYPAATPRQIMQALTSSSTAAKVTDGGNNISRPFFSLSKAKGDLASVLAAGGGGGGGGSGGDEGLPYAGPSGIASTTAAAMLLMT